jgi:beta-phosphoglucomutase-like phosphatase (HAD superfamily)
VTIRAIAWDIDGTLVDSEPLHHRALLAASLRWNADLSDLSDRAFQGVHMHDVWTALAGRLPASLDRADWLAAIDDHYAEGATALMPLTGALEAFRALAAHGLRQVCVSNSNRRIVDANLRALGIDRLVAFSISFDDIRNGKPDPEPYRTACEWLNLRPAEVLAVEDSMTGIRSARSAGLNVAAYAPGHEEIAGVHADVVFSRFDQLLAWVGGQLPAEGDR